MKESILEYGEFVSKNDIAPIQKKVTNNSDYALYDWEKYVRFKNVEKNAEEAAKLAAKRWKKIQKANKKGKKLSEKQLRAYENKLSEKQKYEDELYVNPLENLVEISPEKKSRKEKKAEKKAAKAEKNAGKVKHSIGSRLILIISMLVVLSLSLITVLVSVMFSGDTRASAMENNLNINTRTASDCENRIDAIISAVSLFYDTANFDKSAALELRENSEQFFTRNKNIVAVSFLKMNSVASNRQYFQSHDIETSMFDSYILQEEENINLAKNGAIHLENASPFFNSPLIALFFPIYSRNEKEVAVALFSTEELALSFSSGSVNLSYLVNDVGQVLIHPDIDLMMNATDLRNEYIVDYMINSSKSGEQIKFTDVDDIEYYGSYSKISAGNCGVVSLVQSQVILAGVYTTTRRNIYLTIAILSIAILIVWFFSKSLSNPLKDLTEVTNEINKGNFDTELLQQLKSKRNDEIGVLIESTKAEQDILNTFTKLTNKGVTKAIVRKEIDFEPHLKDITIFFSDIRGFTAISDGFNKRFGEKSAGEIINFLNDYMGRMVNCITLSGGNVDKFEGDAIMACWGVLRDDNLDFEKLPDSDPKKAELKAIHDSHVKEDALNAIKATVAMRYSLMEYNKLAEKFTAEHKNDALAKYKPHIRIGSGLNSGRATVGFMGSYDKMEFTSIGDAVNLASRTESSNKPCGTDMLITEDTYNLLKKDYIRCAENQFSIRAENMKDEIIVEMIPVTFEVKGKGKQHFYGVVNMPRFDIEAFFKQGNPDFEVDKDCLKAVGPRGPRTLDDVRTLLGIPKPDFSGVNLDQEENKVQIQ